MILECNRYGYDQVIRREEKSCHILTFNLIFKQKKYNLMNSVIQLFRKQKDIKIIYWHDQGAN